MNPLARQIAFFAPAAVMSAWATVMLHTVISGRINELLSPMFRNYVVIAAALLAILSALYVLLYQPTAEATTAGRLRQLGRWLVLLVPIVAAAVLSPSALSSTTMINRGLDPSSNPANQMPSWNATNQQSVKDAIDADPNQPAPVEVTDLVTLAHAPDQVKGFEGRKVRCVGRLFAGQAGTNPKLVRLIMWCCAADAQPVSVDLTGYVKGQWKDTDWLEVIGAARFPTVNGKVVPTIEAESIQVTQEPDEPYLSP